MVNSVTEAHMLKVLFDAMPTGLTSAELRGKFALPDVTFEQVRESLRVRGYIDEIRPVDRWCILEPGEKAWRSLRPLLNDEIARNAQMLASQAENYVSNTRQRIVELEGKLHESREKLKQCDNRHRQLAVITGLFVAALAELQLIWFWDFFAIINQHKNMVPIHISIMIFLGFLVLPIVYKPWLNFSVVVGIAALFPVIYMLVFS